VSSYESQKQVAEERERVIESQACEMARLRANLDTHMALEVKRVAMLTELNDEIYELKALARKAIAALDDLRMAVES
jgi:hypothetical protein